MAKLRRLIPIVAVLAAGVIHAAPAAASTTQEAVFQDDTQLELNPTGTLLTLHNLGVTRVRVSMLWDTIAPSAKSRRKPSHFSASDPGAYGKGWAMYDTIVRDAQTYGMSVYFMVTGPAPLWATGSDVPRGGATGPWKPSASEFGAFVKAAGKRYSGTYKPSGQGTALPRVNFWSIWNEPNYGYDLAPQATDGGAVESGAVMYRSLLNAAWKGLTSTGHKPGRDTILIGETAPRGVDPVGTYNGTKPLRFLRALYCVDSRYRPLSGTAARLRGCPTSSAGTRAFRGANPALFEASGFADHPYALQANPGPPNLPTNQNGVGRSDPDYADLPEVPRLEATLDRLNRVYGSHTRFPVWNTEYGYRTHPPDPRVRTSQATAALYMNWAEYLSYRQPRLDSYMQYLLVDPFSGVFASGLYLPNGKPKATLDAFRMPLFLPSTTTRKGRALEVWGAVRPARAWGNEQVSIQYQRGGKGSWATESTLTIHNIRGYFDTKLVFPASGAVRLAWTQPGGTVFYSRTQNITIH
jgi:hypothetical protein